MVFDAYADAVLKEIEARREEISAASSVNTLYIGGGTPSVLPLDVLSRIVQSLVVESEGAVTPNPPRSALRPVSPAASHPFMWPRAATGSAATPLPAASQKGWDEFTVEVNPDDIVERGEEYVRGLIELGVNRISMGVQSFDDGILKWMNRRHDSARAVKAFEILRSCGVRNISIDLIFGLPQMEDKTWTETIGKALELAPEHISAYQLSIDEESALAEMVSRGEFAEAGDEQCRRQYDILCERLSKAGYLHYEISNFALPGFEAIHNSAYWRRVPYVGLGPGAHSLSAGGVRSWNSQEIPQRLSDGKLLSYSREEEILTLEDIRIERIMLPLRTDAGLPEKELRSLSGDEAVDRLLSEGALVPVPERSRRDRWFDSAHQPTIRIPEDHFFTSDDIIRKLI